MEFVGEWIHSRKISMSSWRKSLHMADSMTLCFTKQVKCPSVRHKFANKCTIPRRKFIWKIINFFISLTDFPLCIWLNAHIPLTGWGLSINFKHVSAVEWLRLVSREKGLLPAILPRANAHCSARSRSFDISPTASFGMASSKALARLPVLDPNEIFVNIQIHATSWFNFWLVSGLKQQKSKNWI